MDLKKNIWVIIPIIIIFIIVIFLLKNIFSHQKEYFNKDILRTKLWQTTDIDGICSFPENCLGRYNKPESVGLAYSGGGPRTYSALIGYLRGLKKLGVYDKTDYVSSVSGGSWFHAVYTYAKSMNNYSDLQLLGSNIVDKTVDNLNRINFNNTLFMGNRVTQSNVVYNLLKSTIPFIGTPDINYTWPYIVGEIFLKPYNINGNVPFTLDSDFAAEINRNNNTRDRILYQQKNDPFWINNITLQHKEISKFKGENIVYPYVTIPVTPLYSGLLHSITLDDGNIIGGYVTETFAFNANTNLNNITPFKYYKKNTDFCRTRPDIINLTTNKKKIITLKDAIGISSFAYGNDIANIVNNGGTLVQPLNLVNPDISIFELSKLKPTISDEQCYFNYDGTCQADPGYNSKSCTRYLLKCYSNTAEQCKSNEDCDYDIRERECINKKGGSRLNCSFGMTGCKCTVQRPKVILDEYYTKTVNTADGGGSDYTGIVELCSRGVKRIIAFINSSKFIFSKENMQMPNSNICLTDLQYLFGIYSTCEFTLPKKTQIFNTKDYDDLIEQFKISYLSGGPTFARKKLKVIPNNLYNVKGDYEVDLLAIYLHPSSKFFATLPVETQNYVAANISNFPNYKTLFNNPKRGIWEYDNIQVNLLSCYTEWCLEQENLKKHILEIYNA
jgi:hypothetical protein